VLILRLRGPMAADNDQKNLVTRLMTYKKLINIPSVSKLPVRDERIVLSMIE
jgi:hypothetical protein